MGGYEVLWTIQMGMVSHVHERSVKVGIAAKRKMAGWDNDFLFKVLCS